MLQDLTFFHSHRYTAVASYNTLHTMKLLTLFALLSIFVQDANARAAKNSAKVVVKEEPRELSSGEMAAAGAFATAFGVTLVHPIDTIKTLQQSSEGMGLNMLAASRKIMKVKSISILF